MGRAALFVLLVFSWFLSESAIELGPHSVGARAALPGPVPVPVPAVGPSSAMYKEDLRTRRLSPVDRKTFLLGFERQAGDRLMPCLRSSVGEKGSLHLLARLSRRGALSGIRLINHDKLECARSAVAAMTFPQVGAPLTTDTVEIDWRFDW